MEPDNTTTGQAIWDRLYQELKTEWSAQEPRTFENGVGFRVTIHSQTVSVIRITQTAKDLYDVELLQLAKHGKQPVLDGREQNVTGMLLSLAVHRLCVTEMLRTGNQLAHPEAKQDAQTKDTAGEPWTPPRRMRYPVAANPAVTDWAVIPQRGFSSCTGPDGRTDYIACTEDESHTVAVVHDANAGTGRFRNWVVIHDAPSSDEALDWAIAKGYDNTEHLQHHATVVSMPK